MELYKITYKNHINESIQFGVNGLWFVDTELHDYAWTYTSNNGKISNLERGIVEKKIKAVIACKNRDDGIEYLNKIVECCDKDILSNTQGTLYFGDYYTRCYILKSKKSSFIEKKGQIEVELTIVSDNPQWIKEYNSSFSKGSGESGTDLDFPYDFPYDFTSPNTTNYLVNPSFMDADFKIVIYGEVTNPSIHIGGHLYEVNCYVASGEYLTIDSREKTITVTSNNGAITNHFKDRNKSNYIFTKIASGESAVSWGGEFVFDITLYEERSEPKWT